MVNKLMISIGISNHFIKTIYPFIEKLFASDVNKKVN